MKNKNGEIFKQNKGKQKRKKMQEGSSKYSDANVSFLYGFDHILTLEVNNMNASDPLIQVPM